MSWPLALGFIALVGSKIAAHVMQFRASQLLTHDQRNQVATTRVLNRISSWHLLFYPGLMIAGLAAILPSLRFPWVYALLLLWVTVMGWHHVALREQLRRLALPNAYLKRAWHSELVTYGGLFALVVSMAYEFARVRS
jgi:hypothetical protein